MKPEKEFAWLLKLSTSDYCGNLFKTPKLGCKKDFERLLNAPENDKEFTRWFNSLISSEIFVYSENIQKNMFGRSVPGYNVNLNNTLEFLRTMEYYDLAHKLFNSRAIMPVPK